MLSIPTVKPSIPKKDLIIHNDLDGLLSWLFLRERGYGLRGVYDLESLYLQEGILPSQLWAVDLDLSTPEISSFGHHMTLFSGSHHWNINDWCLPKENRRNYFSSKCPLPTILLLHWLTDTPLPNDPMIRALFVYTDTLVASYYGAPHNPRNYQFNVTQWLKALQMDDLLEDLQTKRLLPYFDRWKTIIGFHGRELKRDGFHFKVRVNKPFPQCRFTPSSFPLLLPFCQTLIHHLSYRPLTANEFPNLHRVFQGYRYSLQFNETVESHLQKKFEQGELFSHGLIFKHQVEVTLTSPLSHRQDPTLIQALKPFPYATYHLIA